MTAREFAATTLGKEMMSLHGWTVETFDLFIACNARRTGKTGVPGLTPSQRTRADAKAIADVFRALGMDRDEAAAFEHRYHNMKRSIGAPGQFDDALVCINSLLFDGAASSESIARLRGVAGQN